VEAFFCFSPDKNFILKTIEPDEAKLLKKILSQFHEHIAKNPKSFINRLYGFHSVKVHNLKIYALVMGNVFNTKLSIHEKYDLKFSWVKRFVKGHSEKPSMLGKDLNLKRKLKLDPFKTSEVSKQIENDVRFLSSHGIMDYSLLVGFHFHENEIRLETKITSEEDNSMKEFTLSLENKGILSVDGKETYFIGVIDILQQYNFNKKMERCFKVNIMHADKNGLSVQPVDIYCERFVSKLDSIIECSN